MKPLHLLHVGVCRIMRLCHAGEFCRMISAQGLQYRYATGTPLVFPDVQVA